MAEAVSHCVYRVVRKATLCGSSASRRTAAPPVFLSPELRNKSWEQPSQRGRAMVERREVRR